MAPGFDKKLDRCGPAGGYHCPCCGPSPKDRQRWRRVKRKRLNRELPNHENIAG